MPKYRRQAVDGEMRASWGGIFQEFARQKEGRLVAGHVLAAHGHRCSEIPPQPAVASLLGCLQGKRAGASAREVGGKRKNVTGAHCWARGSAVSTVGYELEVGKRDIRDQDDAAQAGRFSRVIAVFETAQPSKPPASRGVR